LFFFAVLYGRARVILGLKQSRGVLRFFLEKYNSLGIIDNLITASESKEPTDVESKVKTIVQHLLQGTLRTIESGYPSKHHYEI